MLETRKIQCTIADSWVGQESSATNSREGVPPEAWASLDVVLLQNLLPGVQPCEHLGLPLRQQKEIWALYISSPQKV